MDLLGVDTKAMSNQLAADSGNIEETSAKVGSIELANQQAQTIVDRAIADRSVYDEMAEREGEVWARMLTDDRVLKLPSRIQSQLPRSANKAQV